MIDDELRCLQAMPIFAQIAVPKLKLLAMVATRMTFDVGTPIMIQGEPASAVHIIVEGEAEVRRETNGAVLRLAVIGRGTIVGDFGIYLDRPHSATIVPLSPVSTLQVSAQDYLDLLMQVPQLSLGVIRQLSRMVIDSNDRYAAALLS